MSKNTTLKRRTDNPDALAFDKAVELFREGIALGRQGRLEDSLISFTKSFLLDTE